MSKPRILSEEEIKFIIDKYCEPSNWTIDQISKSLNSLKGHKIKKVLLDNNISLRPKYWRVKKQKTTKLSQENIQNLIQDYKNDISIENLEIKYNICYQTILTYLYKHNCELRPQKSRQRNLSEDEKQLIISLYKENKSITYINITTKINYEKISNFLKEINLFKPIPAIPRTKEIDENKLKELCLDETLSLSKISKILNISFKTLQKTIKRLNLTNYYTHIPKNKIILTNQEIETIKYLREKEQLSIEKISKELNISPKAIQNAICDLDLLKLPAKGNFAYLQSDDIKSIIDQYINKQITLIQIAKQYHISIPNLKRLIIENGYSIRSSKTLNGIEQEIKNDYENSTLTITAICKKYNVTGKVIYRCCEGLTRKYKSEFQRPQRKPLFKDWLEKYGEEEGNKKIEEYKNKATIDKSGGKNGMYGKPAPQGSGNGWKGWYKGIFFRSLRELSFMYDQDLIGNQWNPAENKKYKIEYTDINGQIRNYFPDFIIGNIIYELKPQRLINSQSVKLKTEAALIWCKNNGYEYIITDWNIIDVDIIYNLVTKKEIVFQEKYLNKFLKYYNSN